MFVFYPTQDYSNTKLIDQKQETPNVSINNSKSENKVFSEEGFMSFSESDFDFYVYRAHVLSSQKNANKLKEKINNGGFPSFVEPFGDKKELFAVYVGPFLTEDDIVNNIKLIQELSESKKGEISRWKL